MMKNFILRVSLFLMLIFFSVIGTFALIDKSGVDHFYARFTTLRQTSLILGSSRSAQGLQPSVLNDVLSRTDIYNYSFTFVTSPFGPTYFKSIQKKLEPLSKNGIFIIGVDPWSLSTEKKYESNNEIQFPERQYVLGKINMVNLNPNIEYLLKCYNKPFYNLFIQNKFTKLHNDGWLEVNVPMDKKSIELRTQNKIKEYQSKLLPQYAFSKLRLIYLKKIISYLKSKGRVFLVRLPVHSLMKKIDNQLIPNFDGIMHQTASQLNCEYINLSDSNDNLMYTDGNHLYKKSGKEISIQIGKYIKSKQ